MLQVHSLFPPSSRSVGTGRAEGDVPRSQVRLVGSMSPSRQPSKGMAPSGQHSSPARRALRQEFVRIQEQDYQGTIRNYWSRNRLTQKDQQLLGRLVSVRVEQHKGEEEKGEYISFSIKQILKAYRATRGASTGYLEKDISKIYLMVVSLQQEAKPFIRTEGDMCMSVIRQHEQRSRQNCSKMGTPEGLFDLYESIYRAYEQLSFQHEQLSFQPEQPVEDAIISQSSFEELPLPSPVSPGVPEPALQTKPAALLPRKSKFSNQLFLRMKFTEDLRSEIVKLTQDTSDILGRNLK